MPTPHDPKGFAKVTVANAGTPVPVKPSAFHVKGFTFQSDPANAGTYVFIKDASGNTMLKLTKGQSGTLPMLGSMDLSQVLIDSDTNGDGGFAAYV